MCPRLGVGALPDVPRLNDGIDVRRGPLPGIETAAKSCANERGPSRERFAGLLHLAPRRVARSTILSNLCAAQKRARSPSAPYLGRFIQPGSAQRGFWWERGKQATRQ